MRIFGNILDFISKNKKNIFFILLFVVYFLHSTDFAFAANNGGGGSASATPSKENNTNMAVDTINMIIKMPVALVSLISLLVGWFLRPEWTSGSAIGLDTQLKTLWILISNIVYFIFAGIFVMIAFMNIIGHGDHYELKKAIPKFIVGVLIVPFSWFFVQFILSISSVLTVAVLSLPYDTFPNLKLKEQNMTRCSNYEIKSANSGSTMQCANGGEKSGKLGDFIKENDNSGLYSIMSVYTYGVMKMDDTGKLFKGELLKGMSDIWGLTLKALFDLVLLVVYMILLVALFLAFLSRGIVLWFYMIFSPLFGLLYFFGKGKDGIMGNKFSIKEFVALAMVPVYVAAALSFGMLFLFVASKGFSEGKSTTLKMEQDGTVKVNNTTLKFEAIKTMDDKKKGKLFEGFTGPLGALLLELLGIAILWVAVMAALHQSKITESVTHDFDAFGKSIGGMMAKLPSHAPILPGGLSAAGLAQVGQMPQQAMSRKVSEQIQPFQDRINKAFNVNTIPTTEQNEMKQALDNGIIASEWPKVKQMYNDWVSKYGRNDPIVQNYEKQIAEALKKSNLTISGVTLKDIDPNKLDQNSPFFRAMTDNNSSKAAELYNAKNPNKYVSPNSPPTQTNPGTGQQTIVINTNTPGVTNNVSLDLKDGVVQGSRKFEEMFKDAKGQYSEADFETMLTSKGVSKDEAGKIIKELKSKISGFFK